MICWIWTVVLDLFDLRYSIHLAFPVGNCDKLLQEKSRFYCFTESHTHFSTCSKEKGVERRWQRPKMRFNESSKFLSSLWNISTSRSIISNMKIIYASFHLDHYIDPYTWFLLLWFPSRMPHPKNGFQRC